MRLTSSARVTALVDMSASRSQDQTAKPSEGPGPEEILGNIVGATLPESARMALESARIALESATIVLESASVTPGARPAESARIAMESASATPGSRPMESAPARRVSGGGPEMPGICAAAADGMKPAESIAAVRASRTARDTVV